MYSLVNSNFSRTYNPNTRQNALCDIKRLLTSRDTVAQNKACGYLIEVINRYNKHSGERARMVEYLLENDITVFLCEATSNLEFGLFKSVLACLRLVLSKEFFKGEHAAQCMTAVVRSLAHYASTGLGTAVDACLHFLCDLLDGISTYKTTAPLSNQSAYSAVQLLACFDCLSQCFSSKPNCILASSLLLHALVSYQPDGTAISASTARAVSEVLRKWFTLLLGGLNQYMLVGDNGISDMFFAVVCQLGMDALRLVKFLSQREQKVDFIQTILADDHEITALNECALEISSCVHRVMSELVVFTKDHQNQIKTEEYSVFLKLLLNFFYDNVNSEVVVDFCELLFCNGYLSMLPQAQIMRNDISVRKVSTLVLGEILKVLSEKYLNVNNSYTCANDITLGLVDLQYGIEKPHNIGMQLQRGQPYSLLIYIYFYCQSSENPEEATAPLLPYLVEHILKFPKSFKPPPYIIKALWLVFAMSTISNGSLNSLDQRVYLEKATDRLVSLLHPEPSVYYTHNPALLLWAFTSQRIPNYVKSQVLSQWLKTEDSLPPLLSSEPAVWELLLNVLTIAKDNDIVTNCIETLYVCLDEADDGRRENFATVIWEMLPTVLSKVLIDCASEVDSNTCHLLELATTLLPNEMDQTICLKIAVLITTIFSKNPEQSGAIQSRYHYEYVCLKLSLYLLGLANNQNDNRVLLTYMNRPGFLPRVLATSNSTDDRVACSALQLLSYTVHYFTKYNYQPKTVLQVQTHLIINSLRRDSTNERGASLLQLVYMVLNSGANTPLVMAYDVEAPKPLIQQCNALRALMLRIQLMLCCRDSKNQASAGWKTLSSIFKHAIVSTNDTKLVAILTSQPWTHVLIHFQLTQKIIPEFLNFIHNWLTLLKITIKTSRQEKRTHMGRHSLVNKTMVLLKKNLVAEDNTKELSNKIQAIVKEILEN